MSKDNDVPMQGTVKEIKPKQQVGKNNMDKQSLILTTKEQYPQVFEIEFLKDKCSLLEGINVGDEVAISFNLRGRDWTSPQGETKYFSSIQGWRISKTGEAKSEEKVNGMPKGGDIDDDSDSLPF